MISSTLTTKSFAEKNKTNEENSIFLVTPFKQENDFEFYGAVYAQGFPWRSVCMKPEVYRELRTDQLTGRRIETICKERLNDSKKDVWSYAALGFLTGILFGDIVKFYY